MPIRSRQPLRHVSGLCFQGGRAVAEPGGLLVGAGKPRLGRWHFFSALFAVPGS
jgi:hypothetical protein